MKSRDFERPSDGEAIEATAAAWLAARDEGLSPEERTRFISWPADPRHAAAMARLRKAWETLEQLRDFRRESGMHPDPACSSGCELDVWLNEGIGTQRYHTKYPTKIP